MTKLSITEAEVKKSVDFVIKACNERVTDINRFMKNNLPIIRNLLKKNLIVLNQTL